MSKHNEAGLGSLLSNILSEAMEHMIENLHTRKGDFFQRNFSKHISLSLDEFFSGFLWERSNANLEKTLKEKEFYISFYKPT